MNLAKLARFPAREKAKFYQMPLDLARLQAFAWIGLGLVFLWLLYLLAPILTPFVLAAVLAYICEPLTEGLARRGVPRSAAVVLVLLLLAALILLMVLIVAPLVVKEGRMLAQRLPGALDALNDRVAPWLSQQFDITLQFDVATLRSWLSDNTDTAQQVASHVLRSLRIGGTALIGLVANLLLVPMVMFYLMRDWPHILARIEAAIPRPWHDTSMRLLGDVDRVLAEFLRGQLSVMLVLAVYYSAGLWLAGVNFALPVGLLTGLLVFIPYVGFGGGLVLALLVAALQFEGPGPVIGVAVVYTLGQVVESFLLTPYLVGERIGLHPLAVIFALLAFGQLFGFVGVLIALPASAALLVGLRELQSRYLASPFYRGPDGAA